MRIWNRSHIPSHRVNTSRWRFVDTSSATQYNNYSHCILNRPVTQEMSNSFKFSRVGPARWLLDALLPLVRNARFLPASCPVQRPVQLKWLQRFAPPISPSGGWSRIPSLFGMPIVLAVAVSSHNLVPHVGTIGMKYEYYTSGTVFARLVLCCSLRIYSRTSIAICPKNKNKY